MIKINMSPVRSDELLTVAVQGSVLVVNGTDFDLSEVPDGATARRHPVLGDVTRTGNDYELTLTVPHGPQDWQQVGADDEFTYFEKASQAQRFPEPITVTEDGPVALPEPDKKSEPLPEATDNLTEEMVDFANSAYGNDGTKKTEEEMGL